jgi:hypothetical protein
MLIRLIFVSLLLLAGAFAADTSVVIDGVTGNNVYPAGAPWDSLNDLRCEARIHDMQNLPSAGNFQRIWECGGIAFKYGLTGTTNIAAEMSSALVQLDVTGRTDFFVRAQRVCSTGRLYLEIWDWDGSNYATANTPSNVPTCPSSVESTSKPIGHANTDARVAWVKMYSTTLGIGSPPPTQFESGAIAYWKFDNNLTNEVAGVTTTLSGATYAATPTRSPIAIPKSNSPVQATWQTFPVVRAGTTVTLKASDSLILGDTAGFSCIWQQLTGPTTLTIAGRKSCTPSLSGFVFGEYTVQLSITDGSGNQSAPTVFTIGSVATDSKGIVVVPNADHDFLLGPMVPIGYAEQPYYDERNVAFLDKMQTLLDTVGGDLNAGDTWNHQLSGSIYVTGSGTVGDRSIVLGSGTTFQDTFCASNGTLPHAPGIPFDTFSVNTSTSVVTVTTNTGLYTTATPVRVRSAGTLPTGLSATTTYYVRLASGGSFRLATTNADTSLVTLTDSGTGTTEIYQDKGPRIVVWSPLSATVFDSALRGRVFYEVASCDSQTQITLKTPYYATSHVLSGSGLAYSYMDLDTISVWGFSNNPFNYYDGAMAAYSLYYRTGLTRYLTLARRIADEWFQYPMLSAGATYSDYTGTFNTQSTGQKRNMALVGLTMRMKDGRPEMLPGLSNIYENVRSGGGAGGAFLPDNNAEIKDVRESAYEMQFMSLCAKFASNSGHITNLKTNCTTTLNNMISVRYNNFQRTKTGGQIWFGMPAANMGDAAYTGTVGTMPYMLTITMHGLDLAVRTLEELGGTTNVATATLARTFIAGLGEYLRVSGKAPTGIYIATEFDTCPTGAGGSAGSCANFYDRGWGLEAGGGFAVPYAYSGYTNTALKTVGQDLNCEIYGNPAFDSSTGCSDSSFLNQSVAGNTYYFASTTFFSKWVGQNFGNSHNWAVSAHHRGAPDAVNTVSYTIPFTPSTVHPSADRIRWTTVQPDGITGTGTCTAAPCTISYDRRKGPVRVLREYMNSSGLVLRTGTISRP